MVDNEIKNDLAYGYTPNKIKDPKAILILLGAIAAILSLPMIGLYFNFNGIIPPDFFEYPPVTAPAKPGFNLVVAIILGSFICCAILLYVKPSIFGFEKVAEIKTVPIIRAAFPIWGWIGIITFGIPLVFLWGHFSGPKIVLNWAWIPIFWGYTLIMDGWLYVRTGGKSIIKDSPKEMIAIGVAAMGGWMLFEYLNFFVDDNWFYPNGMSIPDDEFLLYAIVGSSGLIPVIFVIYRLLNTFPKFKNKYSKGPKLTLNKWIINLLLIVFLGGMFAINFYPDILFGLLWIAPMGILAIVLEKIGLWTPFSGLKTGNWSPLLKYSLTYLIYGVSLECINYFSAIHPASGPLITHTPAFWVYSIPYVNFWHLFEMPLFGFLGYLPFGIYCSVWWITFAYLLNIPTTYLDDEN